MSYAMSLFKITLRYTGLYTVLDDVLWIAFLVQHAHWQQYHHKVLSPVLLTQHGLEASIIGVTEWPSILLCGFTHNMGKESYEVQRNYLSSAPGMQNFYNAVRGFNQRVGILSTY